MRSSVEQIRCGHKVPAIRVGDSTRGASACTAFIEIKLAGDQELAQTLGEELERLAERAGWRLGFCPEHAPEVGDA